MEPSIQPNDVSAQPAVTPTLPELSPGNQSLADIMRIPNPIVMPPVSPSGSPQNIDIASQQQGNFQTGPNPGAKPINQPEGNLDYIRSLGDSIQDDSLVKDKFKYGRQYSYGADYKNLDFERYYSHSKFKEIGFSPYRDNEAIYNEKGSWWDDFNRARGQWLGIAWNSGFKGVWGDSTEANEAMNKGMAIGSSSKEGLGAWTTNLFLNSSFTAGIMGEMLVEDLALAGADVLTAGIGTPEAAGLAAARGGLAIGRLKKTYNFTSDFISALRDADKAKEFFSAAKAGETAKAAMNFLNPLEHSTAFVDELLHGTNGLRDLKNKTKIVTGFGEFYKDMREINLAHAEAKMEAQSGSDQKQQELINKYYDEHGQMPDGDNAQNIYKESKDIKGTITLVNDMFILYSNKLVFENLFDGIVPGKAVKAALTGSGKEIAATAAKDLTEGADVFKAADKSMLKKTSDFLFKSEYSPISKAYILGNLAEGIQESGQDIIQFAAKDYYDKIDKDPTQVGMASTLASIGTGTGQEFNEQGLSTFMSGYMMGAMIQPVTGGMMRVIDMTKTMANNAVNAYKANKTGEKPIVEKSDYQKAKDEKEKTDNNIINALNHIRKNILTYGDTHQVLAAKLKLAQEAKNKAFETGDRVAFENMQDQISMDKFHVLAKTNNMEALTSHVDDLLTLSDEDLEKAWTGKHKAADIREKLTTFKQRAESYQNRFDYAQEKMPNPFNPWRFDSEKQPELFNREYSRHQAHETAVENLLFATEDYDLVAKKMARITNNLSGIGTMNDLISYVGPGADASRAKAQDVSLLIDHSQRELVMKSLPDQISLLNAGNSQQKKEAAKLQKQYDILSEWQDITEHYKTELKSDQKAQIDPAELEKRKQERKYLPGAVLKGKKNGKIYTVKEVKNGKIKTLDENGKERIINKRNIKGELNHEIVKESSQSSLKMGDSGDSLSDAIYDMYNVFDKYIRHIGQVNNGHVFTNKIQEAFHDVKDFYHWENQADNMVRTVNMLSDPDYFNRYRDLLAPIHEARLKRIEPFKEALGTNWNNLFHQSMFNALYEYKVFPDISDIEGIKNFTITKFKDAQTGKPIPEGSELYNQALIVVAIYKEALEQKEEADKKTAEENTKKEAEKTNVKAGGITLESIANKIKNNEELSKKEKEIFTNKTSEVNDILLKMSQIPPSPPTEIKEELKNNNEPNPIDVQEYTVGDITQKNQALINKDGNDIVVDFQFMRSDHPNKVSNTKGGYYYGEKYGNTIDDFFTDYGIKHEALDIEGDVKAIKLLEEKLENGKTSVKVQIQYEGSQEVEIKELNVNKQKFTTDEFIKKAELTNLGTAQKTNITTNDLEAKKADIEKRRQESLNRIDNDSKILNLPIGTYIWRSESGGQTGETRVGDTGDTRQDIVNKLNAKYDAELAALEDKEKEVGDKDKIMSEINKVTTGQELDKWMDNMKKAGFNESEITDLAKQKQAAMTNTLEWSDLKKDQTIIMKNNTTMVIKDIKGDKAYLMTQQGYNSGMGDITVLSKEDLKSKEGVKLISKFASSVATSENVSNEDIKESEVVLDAAKEITDPTKNASNIQVGLETSKDDSANDFLDGVDECINPK